MESEEAAAQLASVSRARRTIADRSGNRAGAWVGIAMALVLWPYLGVMLSSGPDQFGSRAWMLLPGMILAGALARGARRRGGVVPRGGVVGGRVLQATFLVVTLGLMMPSMFGWRPGVAVGWLAAGLPSLALALVSVTALRDARWEHRPSARGNRGLSGAVRAGTLGTGLVIALSALTGVEQLVAVGYLLSLIVALVLAVGGADSPWGLDNVGSQWGLWQWAAFLVSVCGVYLATPLAGRETTESAVLLGAVALMVLVLMGSSAFLPGLGTDD